MLLYLLLFLCSCDGGGDGDGDGDVNGHAFSNGDIGGLLVLLS